MIHASTWQVPHVIPRTADLTDSTYFKGGCHFPEIVSWESGYLR